ncbi:leucine-, glutamate- and lysine-rich protein 1 isoform X2 [Anguilla anguilla]|uniref:leucine-, glutamate- and lysine-rich protein 1 isoform X2 n=1 Tax=Anguilla anguilla TaxID=7936 RepID=UPI0015AEDFEC|nr:leucine-, glutamate- and lysine-rich protein 1 isoform X2 [Anguilla anguilla]
MERSREAASIDEMERHTPVYPLPMEIQQMERSETVCQYCGVSYLILHEIQRLQERLRAAERELEARRGAVEREGALREELQEAAARLAELGESHLEQAQRAKCLDLQLAEGRARLESVSAERDVMERELGKAGRRCQLLRGRSQLQVDALRESLSLLHSCRQELRQEVQRNHAHLLTFWEGWSVQLLQTSRDADAERAELQRAVGGAQAEVTCLREELRELDERLASSEIRAQKLQNQAQNQVELQSRFQEVQTQLLGLKEKVKSLHVNLQDSQSAKEHMETLLFVVIRLMEQPLSQKHFWSGYHASKKSKETEELHVRHIQFEEQRARLSEDLREREKRLLSCEQRCQSLQKQLLGVEQREEEMTQKHMQVESENRTLRTSLQRAQEEISTLTEQSEKAALAHQHTAQQLAEGLKQRAQVEALLQRERAQAELRLKEKEQELWMEKEMELHIEMEKNRELLQQYQREAEQLRKKLPSLVQTATEELRAEVAAAEEKLREMQEGQAKQEERREQEALRFGRTVSELERQLLQARGDGQQGALQLAELRQELERTRQETSVLQEENALLQETVRRECEERGELTAALTQAREELLEIRHAPAHATRGPQRPGPTGPRSPTDGLTKEREASSGSGRSGTFWHGRGGGRRGSQVTLPRLPQERTASVSQARVSLVMGWKERC